MNLIEQLIGQLNTTENTEKIAGAVGADKGTTQNALSNIIPILTKALGNQDANAMGNLLDQAKAGSGNAQDMVSNLLGNKANLIQQFLGKTSNMDQAQSGNFLNQVLPMVMGALGQQKQEQGLDNAQFASALNDSTTKAAQGNSQFGMLTSLLDQDGDGEITDDLLNIGKSMLGNMFR